MVYWKGDTVTTPAGNTLATAQRNIASGDWFFENWTRFLPKTTDLFYANGAISFN